jgi:hypothetical protein
LKVRTIRALAAGWLLCVCALPLAAAPNSGKITGVVVDPGGTPQLGATVTISSEQIANSLPVELLTNDRGRFSTMALPAGTYSIRVTLAGFLPAMQQHIQVSSDHSTLLEIVLGSIFSSFERLRRQPDETPAPDDWTWVLRTSASTRAVLRWQDGGVVLDDPRVESESSPRKEGTRAIVDLTSGADRPGSIANLGDAPATAFAYDVGVGSKGRLLMAGQFGYGDSSSALGLATEWLPSGELGVGPQMTFVVRESRLGPDGLTFRGLRVSRDDELAIGDRVSLRYGAEYLAAGFNGTTSALRPRGEVAVKLAKDWQASVLVAAHPWQDNPDSQGALQTALDALDGFPTLLVRDGHPYLENGLHEEISIDHSFNKDSSLSAAVFHDRSTHTAVIGRGSVTNPDFLQDYFSDAFAYDAGRSGSMGVRLAYKQKISEHVSTTLVYSYGGALGPRDGASDAALRTLFATEYHHSLGARVSTTVPRFGTKFSAGYKWIDGRTVSRLDAFGESLYHLDPYLSMEIRQPLPAFFQCHMEVMADVGNLLGQGYVPVTSGDGQVVLIPSYRYFRGGLSLQF